MNLNREKIVAFGSGDLPEIRFVVGHVQVVRLGEECIKAMGQTGVFVFDVKSILSVGAADGCLQISYAKLTIPS